MEGWYLSYKLPLITLFSKFTKNLCLSFTACSQMACSQMASQLSLSGLEFVPVKLQGIKVKVMAETAWNSFLPSQHFPRNVGS